MTGFHKRKVERQKKAQEFHKEQSRLGKIEERKQLKLEREKEMLEQMEKYKEGLRILNGADESASDEESEAEWKGIADEDEDEDDEGDKPKGILKKREVYGDDGTEVVIEDLANDLDEVAKLNFVNLEKSQKVLEESIDRAKKYAVIAGAEKPKLKKKKFRYLSKNERKDNQRKAITNKRRRSDKD